MLKEIVTLEPYETPTEALMLRDGLHLPKRYPEILIPGINADGSLYPIEKLEAHLKGLHHLAISIFVFDGDALLIQRRASDKYHCGGQWANTCCTHPHFGEEPSAAAMRRLKEELGFCLPLDERLIVEYSTDVGNKLWERERVHMFRAEASRTKVEMMCDLNPDEVSEVRWATAAELRQEMLENASNFTPWFQIYLNRFANLEF